MNELEQTQNSPTQSDLNAQIERLQRLTNLLLLALIVLSFTVTAFLAVQSVRTSRELDQIRPQGLQVSEALKKQDPMIQAFKGKLAEYGQTHPDFAPILAKYGIPAVQAPVLPSNLQMPPPNAPAAPTAPKK